MEVWINKALDINQIRHEPESWILLKDNTLLYSSLETVIVRAEVSSVLEGHQIPRYVITKTRNVDDGINSNLVLLNESILMFFAGSIRCLLMNPNDLEIMQIINMKDELNINHPSQKFRLESLVDSRILCTSKGTSLIIRLWSKNSREFGIAFSPIKDIDRFNIKGGDFAFNSGRQILSFAVHLRTPHTQFMETLSEKKIIMPGLTARSIVKCLTSATNKNIAVLCVRDFFYRSCYAYKCLNTVSRKTVKRISHYSVKGHIGEAFLRYNSVAILHSNVTYNLYNGNYRSQDTLRPLTWKSDKIQGFDGSMEIFHKKSLGDANLHLLRLLRESGRFFGVLALDPKIPGEALNTFYAMAGRSEEETNSREIHLYNPQENVYSYLAVADGILNQKLWNLSPYTYSSNKMFVGYNGCGILINKRIAFLFDSNLERKFHQTLSKEVIYPDLITYIHLSESKYRIIYYSAELKSFLCQNHKISNGGHSVKVTRISWDEDVNPDEFELLTLNFKIIVLWEKSTSIREKSSMYFRFLVLRGKRKFRLRIFDLMRILEKNQKRKFYAAKSRLCHLRSCEFALVVQGDFGTVIWLFSIHVDNMVSGVVFDNYLEYPNLQDRRVLEYELVATDVGDVGDDGYLIFRGQNDWMILEQNSGTEVKINVSEQDPPSSRRQVTFFHHAYIKDRVFELYKFIRLHKKKK